MPITLSDTLTAAIPIPGNQNVCGTILVTKDEWAKNDNEHLRRELLDTKMASMNQGLYETCLRTFGE